MVEIRKVLKVKYEKEIADIIQDLLLLISASAPNMQQRNLLGTIAF